jgi:hypothetical protein
MNRPAACEPRFTLADREAVRVARKGQREKPQLPVLRRARVGDLVKVVARRPMALPRTASLRR